MSGSYLADLRRRWPLVAVGSYAWLLSVGTTLSSPKTAIPGVSALMALWAGFLSRPEALRRVLAIYGFVLLSGLSLALGDPEAPPLKWFELVGWFGFAAVSALDELPLSEGTERGLQRLEPRRATPRGLLLVPLLFGGFALAAWALGRPSESGPKSILVLLGLFAAGLLLHKSGGLMGMSLAGTSPVSSRVPRAQLIRGVVVLVLVAIWAARHLLPG